MHKILYLFFVLISLSGFSQVPFQKTYGQTIYLEECRDIQHTYNGGYIIGGKAYRPQAANNLGDAYLLKIDYFGNVLWGKLYGKGYYDLVEGLGQTSDSGYIMIGTSRQSSQGKPSSFVLRTDKQGVQQWNKMFTHATDLLYTTSMDLTSDGGLIFSNYKLYGAIPPTFSLIKMNAAGDTTWTKSYHSNSGVSCMTVRQTPDDGYILSGYIYKSGFYPNTFLLKLDASGNTQWFKNYDYGAGVINSSMDFTSDGGYVLSGTYNYYTADSMQYYITKTDAAGDVSWTKTYGDSRSLEAKEIIQTGNLQWARTFGNVRTDFGTAVLEDNGNEYLTLGSYLTPGGSYADIYLVRADVNGNSGCNETTRFPTTYTRTVTQDTVTIYQEFIPYDMTIETYANYSTTDNTTYCSAGIENLNDTRLLGIHPNPAGQHIELDFPVRTNAVYFIYDTTGKLQQQGNYSYRQKIDIATLSRGFYTVLFETEGNQFQQKFIVTD